LNGARSCLRKLVAGVTGQLDCSGEGERLK